MFAPMVRNLVLLVEDDEAIRDTMREILEDAGYRVETAADGWDALAKLRGQPERPCVVLLDLMMPVMDGPAFRRAQMKEPALDAIPVIVMSADVNVDATARELRAAGHLRKPLCIDALLDVVAEHAPALATAS